MKSGSLEMDAHVNIGWDMAVPGSEKTCVKVWIKGEELVEGKDFRVDYDSGKIIFLRPALQHFNDSAPR
jgi:hypothetical protein